ncbi:hypothetical protein ACQEVF_44075 [Nonomuraea polychroma]|uniref:hypothetical protein n=1 Tax=Nonomuraea polychroma TaxID=46176 RepID=UPI003D905CE9
MSAAFADGYRRTLWRDSPLAACSPTSRGVVYVLETATRRGWGIVLTGFRIDDAGH